MKIEFLYPELTVYGDTYNIKYLSECSDEIEVIETSIEQTPHFTYEKVDMLYIGSMAESGQQAALEKLSAYKDKLNELINDGTIILCTGTGGEIFGNYIQKNDEKIETLGLLDFNVKYDYENRYHNLYLGRFEDIDVIGFKCQHSHIYDSKEDGLFETVKGMGNNRQDKKEGIRKNNFMYTKLLGPLFIYCPPLVLKFMEMLNVKGDLIFKEDVLESYEHKMSDYKETDF